MIFKDIGCKFIYNHTPYKTCKEYDLENCNTNFIPHCKVVSEKFSVPCKEVFCWIKGTKTENLELDHAIATEMVQVLTIKEDYTLSNGAIAGIVIGALGILAILIGLGYWIIKKKFLCRKEKTVPYQYYQNNW